MSTLVLRPVRQLRPVDLFSSFPFPVPTVTAPSVVLERDGEDGVLTVEAPGLDAGRDLSVEVVGSRLTVSGTRRETTGRARREVRFSRTVPLPEGTGADAVSARYEAGVLRVRVAGMFPAPAAPQTVRVAITSDVPASPAVESTEAAPAVESTEADQADQA
jgi:HSP20 family molecular chaperone IbpA